MYALRSSRAEYKVVADFSRKRFLQLSLLVWLRSGALQALFAFGTAAGRRGEKRLTAATPFLPASGCSNFLWTLSLAFLPIFERNKASEQQVSTCAHFIISHACMFAFGCIAWCSARSCPCSLLLLRHHREAKFVALCSWTCTHDSLAARRMALMTMHA